MPTIRLEYFDLPDHWASALVNGDISGMDDDDEKALNDFTDDMVAQYGKCWCIDVMDLNGDFRRYHDATRFGVLACNVSTYTFDVTPD